MTLNEFDPTNISPLSFQGTKKWQKENDFFKKWFSLPYLTNGYKQNLSEWLISPLISQIVKENNNESIQNILNDMLSSVLSSYYCIDKITFNMYDSHQLECEFKMKLIDSKKTFFVFFGSPQTKLEENLIVVLKNIMDFLNWYMKNSQIKDPIKNWNSTEECSFDDDIAISIANKLFVMEKNPTIEDFSSWCDKNNIIFSEDLFFIVKNHIQNYNVFGLV